MARRAKIAEQVDVLLEPRGETCLLSRSRDLVLMAIDARFARDSATSTTDVQAIVAHELGEADVRIRIEAGELTLRPHEIEHRADAFAVSIVGKHETIRALQRFHEYLFAIGEGMASASLTHPSLEQRVRHLEGCGADG